ncbi:hypothetical protein A2397_02500 [Candidatus Amesbacteria bacterium RIFOXYB1_FULL_44_23]|uniref:Uncharacterized protein n=1 Tax=Candidatus Amesbacteria bacterium RIFOXYB1_FULL_44_23 TaxID=1797263 RepID=A0A1F4ZWJ0_9BACT|nr:MAG: hypothetical protein A2397_02500 [Candidatus Amesbacteria bacterium RIFOXYB1_FULL_44_23]
MSHYTFEKDFSRHPLHYFILLSFLMVGLWGIFWFSFLPAMQLSILVTMSIFYVVWGIMHHHEHKNLNSKIVFEYLLIAMFAILIFGSLLIRT